MPKVSTKENKNIYFRRREELGLSRDAAAELLGAIPADRIEKIENERSLPHPEEILVMSRGYRSPELCNYYCANQCPIGQEYVPEVKIRDLPQIILEMLASLNAMHRKQERLIEITVDGRIDNDELDDFVRIRRDLEKISMTVEALQLWSEQMLANGTIDPEEYRRHCEALK